MSYHYSTLLHSLLLFIIIIIIIIIIVIILHKASTHFNLSATPCYATWAFSNPMLRSVGRCNLKTPHDCGKGSTQMITNLSRWWLLSFFVHYMYLPGFQWWNLTFIFFSNGLAQHKLAASFEIEAMLGSVSSLCQFPLKRCEVILIFWCPSKQLRTKQKANRRLSTRQEASDITDYCWWFRNPANQLMCSWNPMIYRVKTHSRWLFGISEPSTYVVFHNPRFFLPSVSRCFLLASCTPLFCGSFLVGINSGNVVGRAEG